jgi:hypothetical protein
MQIAQPKFSRNDPFFFENRIQEGQIFPKTERRTEPVFLNVYGAQELIPRDQIRHLCSLAGRYDNPISTRFFLAPIDCLKIPAQKYHGWRGCSVYSNVNYKEICHKKNLGMNSDLDWIRVHQELGSWAKYLDPDYDWVNTYAFETLILKGLFYEIDFENVE